MSDDQSLSPTPSLINYKLFVDQITSSIHEYTTEVIHQLCHKRIKNNEDDEKNDSKLINSIVKSALRQFVSGIQKLDKSNRQHFLEEIKPHVSKVELIYESAFIFLAQNVFANDVQGMRLSSSMISIEEFSLMCVTEMANTRCMRSNVGCAWFSFDHHMAHLAYSECIAFIKSIVQQVMIKNLFEFIRIASNDDENFFYGREGIKMYMHEEYNQHVVDLLKPIVQDHAYTINSAVKNNYQNSPTDTSNRFNPPNQQYNPPFSNNYQNYGGFKPKSNPYEPTLQSHQVDPRFPNRIDQPMNNNQGSYGYSYGQKPYQNDYGYSYNQNAYKPYQNDHGYPVRDFGLDKDYSRHRSHHKHKSKHRNEKRSDRHRKQNRMRIKDSLSDFVSIDSRTTSNSSTR